MLLFDCFRPQQGLSIMNKHIPVHSKKRLLFPSPTGVKYYEFCCDVLLLNCTKFIYSFRPQQGLSIMNF